MAGLYNEFLAHIRSSGVAKTSHFQVLIPIAPKAVDRTKFDSGRLLSFRCESADLPGRQLATQDNKIYGPTYKTPYQSIYQEITLNFLETSDLYIRRFFELWINGVFSAASNHLMYPDTYRSDIHITQYDVTAPQEPITQTNQNIRQTVATLSPLVTWHLISSFPTAINQMPVSWSEDGFHRVSVTLAYEYYLMSTPTEPKDKIKPEGATIKQQTGSAT